MLSSALTAFFTVFFTIFLSYSDFDFNAEDWEFNSSPYSTENWDLNSSPYPDENHKCVECADIEQFVGSDVSWADCPDFTYKLFEHIFALKIPNTSLEEKENLYIFSVSDEPQSQLHVYAYSQEEAKDLSPLDLAMKIRGEYKVEIQELTDESGEKYYYFTFEDNKNFATIYYEKEMLIAQVFYGESIILDELSSTLIFNPGLSF